MAVYVYNEFDLPLLDGTKPYLLCADTEKELHDMANRLGADKFCDEYKNPFYIISKSKAKIARNLGAVYGDMAKQHIYIIKEVRRDLGLDK